MIRPLVALVALLTTGCLAATAPKDAESPCAAVPDCLLSSSMDLVVHVHASTGFGLNATAAEVFEQQVLLVSGRKVAWQSEPTLPVLPAASNEAALLDLHPATDFNELHLFIVNTTHDVGGEPASGLAFPGRSPVFLFPRTLDFRVGQAMLAPDDVPRARTILESVVLTHELGHVLGLVDCGLVMRHPHADEDSPCHSNNPWSIMHSRVARIADWPEKPWGPLGPFGWDANDVADIEAARSS